MVLTDPPYGIQRSTISTSGSTYDDYVDDKEIKGYVQLVRRLLVPGGSVSLFTN